MRHSPVRAALCGALLTSLLPSGSEGVSAPIVSQASSNVTDCMHDVSSWRTCRCRSGMAITALRFNGNVSYATLRQIEHFECGSLSPDPAAAPLTNCSWKSIRDSFDEEGWSQCDGGQVISALKKSTSAADLGEIFTLEEVECCDLPAVSGGTPTVHYDGFGSCFNSSAPNSTCSLPGESFLNGLYRREEGCDSLNCILHASYVQMHLYDDTPAPPTLAPPTSIPDTMVPDTGVPATTLPSTPTPDASLPATSVPTGEPDTSAPAVATPDPGTGPTTVSLTAEPTSVTPSPAPSTAKPAEPTAGPDAASLLTTLPATDVPDTPVPPDTLPAPLAKQIMEQREVTESVSAGAAIASAAGVGGGAGSAMRLALVASECVVGDQRKLSWAFHPTGIRVGDNVYVGAIVGNMACVAGFALLASATLSLVNRFAPMRWVMRLAESTDSQGLLRFPSAPLFVFQWFYQSLSLCGFTLLISSEGGHLNMIGIATCGVCLGVPIYIVRVLVKGVPESATYAEDPEHSGLLYTIVCGAGEWVNTFRSRLWVQRYASIVRTWRQKAVYFAFIDLMASFFLSGISALETENWIGCGHVRTAQALVFFGLTCLEGRYWPHARWRDTMVDFVLLGGQCAALGLLAAAYYSGNADHAGFPTSQLLLMLVGYILVAKVVADILTELYIIMTGRRQRIQHLMWKPGRRHTITKSEGRHSFRDPEYAFETHRTSSTVAQSMPSSATTIEADEFTESLDTPVTKARKGSELLSAPPLYQNERQAPHPVERSCYGAPRSPLLATREDVSLL
eukprot:Rhum_TRINITY_DN15000_c1_g1::Rhum_TRINITY_DN15000_c1_g1_i2::g.133027::m.133027